MYLIPFPGSAPFPIKAPTEVEVLLRRFAQQKMISIERSLLEEINSVAPDSKNILDQDKPAFWAVLWGLILLDFQSLEESE